MPIVPQAHGQHLFLNTGLLTAIHQVLCRLEIITIGDKLQMLMAKQLSCLAGPHIWQVVGTEVR